jgi:hypothetical protein
MSSKLWIGLLVCASLCVASSPAPAQQGGFGHIGPSTGEVVGILAALLLLIQDGSDQYVAHYRVTYFGHVNKDLTAGSDVQFRIAGKHVFVKTKDGKEIRARLCDRLGDGVRCGNVAFSPAFHAEP